MKKIYCLKMLKAAGFTTMLDPEQIELRWEELLDFCRQNEEYIRATFQTQGKVKFGESVDSKSKKQVIKYVNLKLLDTFGITIGRKHDKAKTHQLNLVFSF